MKFFIILFSFLILISSGCAEEDSLNYAEVHCYVKGQSASLFAGKLVLESGRINIERIEVAATTFTGENITASHLIPESYGDFVFVGNDPRQPAIIKFTANIYHDLNIDFYPHQDSYKLILRDTVYGEVPIPSDSNDGDGGSDSGNEDEEEKDDGDNEGDDSGGENGGEVDEGSDDEGKDNDDEDDDEDEGEDNDEDDDEDDNDKDDEDDYDDDSEDEEDDDGRIYSQRNGKTVDMADFLANAKPSLVLLGEYNDQSTQFTVLVSIGAIENFL